MSENGILGLMEIISKGSRIKALALASNLWAVFVVSPIAFYPTSVAAQCPCTFTPANLIEVVDARTARFEVEGEEILIRLEGIEVPALEDTGEKPWCPEEGEKATEAREFVVRTLGGADEILIDLEGKQLSGIVHTGVYVDGLSMGRELLYKYLAVESDSGVANWCQ